MKSIWKTALVSTMMLSLALPAVAASVVEPAECDNVIVAHRGGAKESNTPDNSLAALKYTQSLGCYASECDIYITADNKLIVGHVDNDGKFNGYYPFEATLEQIRSNGKLANGETIPTLDEFLDQTIKDGSCTKLWIDIKNVTKPQQLSQYPIAACKEACRIIKERNAEKWVEFICTSNPEVMAGCSSICKAAGIPIAWMSKKPASTYKSHGYDWSNMNSIYMRDPLHNGKRTIDEFNKAGVKLSVYVIDEKETKDYYLENIDKLKAITTNHPAELLKRLRAKGQ